MARITATIKPVHADHTVCTHKVTTTGKPKEAACPGRAAYTATCSACPWTKTSTTKAALEYVRDSHLRSHLTKPAPTRAV
ncbi:hypothetical protein ABT390_33890 [Streptomyces aurantiacus]|uniref:Uncharacterized protein n=1 Tax=Streptomyces aurantiacus JA 4570 TaxID=1286094 RepID=S4A7X5_9ACTN|nr:hypothetical protein [Streptomyces aurantiacus]EPH46890.1 hypothetical protein STRAU_0056 [Streptomyces aurantiacus JA 4570]